MELTFLDFGEQLRAEAMSGQLNDHQRNVVLLLAEGRTAKVIARELNLAPRTVERHIFDCRRKVGAKNNAHLIARVLRGR